MSEPPDSKKPVVYWVVVAVLAIYGGWTLLGKFNAAVNHPSPTVNPSCGVEFAWRPIYETRMEIEATAAAKLDVATSSYSEIEGFAVSLQDISNELRQTNPPTKTLRDINEAQIEFFAMAAANWAASAHHQRLSYPQDEVQSAADRYWHAINASKQRCQ
jgi:hypothetical protein